MLTETIIFTDNHSVFAAHVDGFPMCGKTEKMIRHLRICENVSETVRQWANDQATSSEKGPASKENRRVETNLKSATPGTQTPSSDIPSSKRIKVSHSIEDLAARSLVASSEAGQTSEGNITAGRPFPQATFEEDVAKLFIANEWAWNGANSKHWRRFVHKYIPDAAPVAASRLSGPILDKLAAGVEERMKPAVAGEMATGQCDGWKNIVKNSLVSSLITVKSEVRRLYLPSRLNSLVLCIQPYLVATHNISSVPKTAETLLGLVLADIEHCQKDLHVKIVAWCSDAGGDAAKMRRMLKQRIPSMVVVDCWAHQVSMCSMNRVQIPTFI